MKAEFFKYLNVYFQAGKIWMDTRVFPDVCKLVTKILLGSKFRV